MTHTEIPAGWKKTIIVPLVRIMFAGVGEDLQAAWDQAIQLIKCYAPETEQELRVLVRMAILNAQANLSFAESVEPNITTSQAIRLRTIGLSLIKAADKAEQRFRQLQSSARTQKAKTAAPVPEEAPASDKAPASNKAPAPGKTPEPEKAPGQTPKPKTLHEQARAISEYARKNNLSYPEAWARHERQKKATQAQPTES